MRRAESVPPDQFVEFNTFYLNPGTQLPPLAPQAYFTYAKDESIHQVLADIHNNLGVTAELEGVALWIRPPPPPPVPVAAVDLDASDSSEDDEASADGSVGPAAEVRRLQKTLVQLLPRLSQSIRMLAHLILFRTTWCCRLTCRPSCKFS